MVAVLPVLGLPPGSDTRGKRSMPPPACFRQCFPWVSGSSYPDPEGLALDADHLAQLVHDLDQVRLGGHHGVDRLVGHGRLVDDILILAALDPGRGPDMVLDREAPLGLVARHRPARTVA